MSQKNIQKDVDSSQEDSQRRRFSEIVRKLDEKEMNRWQKEKIEEKFALTMMNINLDIEIAAAQKRNERLGKQINDADEEFETLEKEMAEIQEKQKIMKEEQDEANAHGNDLTKRTIMIEAMQRMQLDPKQDHHLKLINTITKKIEDAEAYRDGMDGTHVEEMAKTAELLNSCEAKIAQLVEEETKIKQEIEKSEAAKTTENEELAGIQEKVEEALKFLDEIQSIEEATEKLKAEKEAVARALNENRVKIDTIHISNIDNNEKIEELKLKMLDLQSQEDFLHHSRKDYAILTKLIEQKPSIEAMECNEVFQREVMGCLSYIANKENAQTKMSDNEFLIQDLQNVNNRRDEMTVELENLRETFKESGKMKISLQRDLKENKKKEMAIQIKLRDHQNQVHQTKEALKFAIIRLQTEFVKEEGDLDDMRNFHATKTAELSMILKREQSKTQQAQERQIAAMQEEEAMSKSFNNSFGANMSYSQPAKRQKLNTFRQSSQTPPMSSSFETLPGLGHKFKQRSSMPSAIPVYKQEVKKEKQPESLIIDAEGAFSDDAGEDPYNITFNTDVEDFMDETRSYV